MEFKARHWKSQETKVGIQVPSEGDIVLWRVVQREAVLKFSYGMSYVNFMVPIVRRVVDTFYTYTTHSTRREVRARAFQARFQA